MAEKNSSQNKGDEDSDSDENTQHVLKPLELDLGDDVPHSSDSNREGSRRDDNPFSFKHFLKGDSRQRPRVYREARSNSHPRKVADFSSALPDFVQDHLVIEQCLLGTSNCNLSLSEINNCDARNSETGAERDPIPLDLPGLPLGTPFPLDLPISSSSSTRNGPPLAEVGNSGSLPDFLADGAVCPSGDSSPSVSSIPNGHNEIPHGSDLDSLREQLQEKIRECSSLRAELETERSRAQRDTCEVASALQSVENNLERSNRRATTAENTVTKLRQELKALKVEVAHLKSENESLRNAPSCSSSKTYLKPSNDLQAHQFAQELRSAATRAEQSLRQLLSGVDNLRAMASTLDSMQKIEETQERFCNFDEDAGPAL